MKTRFLLAAGVAFLPRMGWAQGAVHTDTAGNPVTSFNLGAGTVTGTLAAERLPAAARPPVVQTVSQTAGDVTLGPGTNVAVLGGALTGALHLTLPAAGSYPAGRALVVADPGGYSTWNFTVSVTVPSGNRLNNVVGATAIVLSGGGSASLFPDGATRWTTGQSRLVAPTNDGLIMTGPADAADERLLAVRTGSVTDALAVYGDGTTYGQGLVLAENLCSDDYNFFTDGNGAVNASQSSAPVFVFSDRRHAGDLSVPSGQLALYYGFDGKLHCLTPDGAEHVLTWTP